MSEPLRILLVEDSVSDAKLVMRELRRLGRPAEFDRVQDAEAMQAALREQTWDVIISDWSMPGFGALGALSVLEQTKLELPLIIVSGTVGEETAVAGLRAGALDFVTKANLSRLVPAVERELRESSNRRTRRQKEQELEQALRDSEARYRALFTNSPLPMWVYDRDTLAFVSVNTAAVAHYGYSQEEFLSMRIPDLWPPEDVPKQLPELELPPPITFKSVRHRRKDGSIILVEIKRHDMYFDGRRERVVVANDVTERERAQEALRASESRLRQAQKMEAVGRLAGGVAHDFNNLLSVILSCGEFVLSDLPAGDELRADVEEILRAGQRAAGLTRQLLLFSRQRVLEPKVLDLNELLLSMEKMLARIVGEDVELRTVMGAAAGKVRVDPGSIEQVLMNLVVNSRDAMPTGGQITIETRDITLDEAFASEHAGVNAGPHVMLAVSDTGIGMDRATQLRIFEPFYTTKPAGKGTGLGLSTVFGIVQQSGGTVWVYSEPGQGATFKVYLPQVAAAVDVIRASVAPRTLRGSETILLVEDEDQIRMVVRAILSRSGYEVLEARNGPDALALDAGHSGIIDLLLTDVVMPQMSGPEVAERLRAARPSMKVLCMSGYTDDSVFRHAVLDRHFAYIQKPITPDSLTQKVREVLDS
ncbi:MAG TPA: response regulator [Polyangiaceae bacterium]